MSEISTQEAHNLAASLISGIRNSLLFSMEAKEQQLQDHHGSGERTFMHNNFQATSYNGNSCTSRIKRKSVSNNKENILETEDTEYSYKTSWLNKKQPDLHQTETTKCFNQMPDHEIIRYGKKCPKCFEINERNANWCMECGKAIISVEVRRCDSLEESEYYPPPCKSQSFPLQDKFTYRSFNSSEEEYLALPSTSNNLQFGIPAKGESNCYNHQNELSASFDFHNPHFEDNFHYNQHTEKENHALCKKTIIEDNKKTEFLQLYAFDDLLYPSYAIHDPVLGYVLPTSNIVSNGAFFHPQVNIDVLNSSSGKVFKEMNAKELHKKIQKHSTNKLLQITKKSVPFNGNDCEPITANISVATSPDGKITFLPEEVILFILSFLSQSELSRCARVSKKFNRITSDELLWKTIKVKKNNLTDKILMKIASKHPTSLTITQCNGKCLTMDGLRTLFRTCADSLQVLDISGCSGGVLVGETLLLHVSARCKNIQSLDVSWNNVTDVGVQSICNTINRLVHFYLNGCQAITDETIKCVAEKHGQSLEVLELFGCFNISPQSINSLAMHCKNIHKLNLGQCHKITYHTVSTIAKNMTNLENLDLRGCKQVRDSSLKDIATFCQQLTTLVIANCPKATDATLFSLASLLPNLICLDACGCGKITDRGVQALSRGCKNLQILDLSSTKVTGRSISAIAHNCRETLVSLKLSFCHSITDSCLFAVVSKCKMLKTLHLYGCKPLRNLMKIMEMNPKLKVEKESLR